MDETSEKTRRPSGTSDPMRRYMRGEITAAEYLEEISGVAEKQARKDSRTTRRFQMAARAA